MAETHDFGPKKRLFLTALSLIPKSPPIALVEYDETDPPYRVGHALAFRIWPLNWAVVLGAWFHTGRTEEEAALSVLSGRGLDLYDADLSDPDVKAAIRDKIARTTDDPEQEWILISHLGVNE